MKAAKRALEKAHKGKPVTPALIADFLKAESVDKSLRLVFARGVDGKTISEAFAERLKAAPAAPVAALKAALSALKLERGSVLSLSASSGKLTVTSGAAKPTTIASKELVSALFAAYLGESPVVPEAKSTFAAALAAKLK